MVAVPLSAGVAEALDRTVCPGRYVDGYLVPSPESGPCQTVRIGSLKYALP
ncbi:hypothetical protein PVAG01_11113 [Phlyctema vagabunda]|uniref:Uncharacterized protein n=1 Tax=Phlyctema vagabunda TaxID=108571 RepID=A0ABR4P1D7_9HELO